MTDVQLGVINKEYIFENIIGKVEYEKLILQHKVKKENLWGKE